MRNYKFDYNNHSSLKDIGTFDLLKLREMGLNDKELSKELRIPKANLTELFWEYDNELQGD
ncbi:MAG: hypothetical protein WDA24_07420 [Tissierellales bacterium]